MKKAIFCLVVSLFLSSFILYPGVDAGAQLQDKDLFYRADLLIKISLRYIKLKDFRAADKSLKAACKIAEKIEEPYSRGIILFELADKYLLINNFKDTYKLAKLIEFTDVRSEAAAKIAYKYAELKDYAAAQETIKQIEDPFSKANALYKIVNMLTDSELYDEAIKITKGTEDSYSVIEELVIAQILGRKFSPRDSGQIANLGQDNFNSTEELYGKFKNLVEIADRYFGISLFEPAKRILGRAAVIAGRINLRSLRQDALQKIKTANDRIAVFEKSLITVR
jgi:tetratricopeptide (TPR) repeat protein